MSIFSLTLKQRVLGFMTLLGLMPILAFGITAYSMWKSSAVEKAFERANAGALNLTEINALAYAVVMESRGIYMSKTWAEAKSFGEGLERQLQKMQALMARWKADNVIESERSAIEALEKSVEQFATLRREIVARAKAEDLIGARALGDNDANRKTRRAMNTLVDDLVQRYKQHEAQAHALKAELDRQNVIFLTVLAIAAIVIGGIGAYSLQKTVLTLFSRMRHAMVEIAAGNLDIEFAGAERKDEVGDFARAITKFKTDARTKLQMEAQAREQNAAAEAERARIAAAEAKRSAEQAQAIDLVAEALHKLADGDLTNRIEADVAPDFQRLKNDFNQTIDKLRETLLRVSDNSAIIASGTQHIDAAAHDLAARTEHQAATLEETAAALDEITTTVRKTSEGAARAQEMAAITKSSADAAAIVVHKAVAAVGGIEKSSQQISQIIGVIDEIAFQTNLLALNAGVEAARAGDSGRGFAVVASEVRALAQRSADAAKEIKELIATSTTQVAEGVTFVGDTGRSLTEIQAHVNEIAEIIAGIAVAAREEATGLSEVNTAVNQIDQVTQQNAAMVQQTNDASRSLTERTQEMAELIGTFRLGAAGAGAGIGAKPGLRTAAASSRQRASAPSRVAGTSALKTNPAAQEWADF